MPHSLLRVLVGTTHLLLVRGLPLALQVPGWSQALRELRWVQMRRLQLALSRLVVPPLVLGMSLVRLVLGWPAATAATAAAAAALVAPVLKVCYR